MTRKGRGGKPLWILTVLMVRMMHAREETDHARC